VLLSDYSIKLCSQLQLRHVSSRTDSPELRKLIRQQDESTTEAPVLQFDDEIKVWAQGLEQLGLDMAQFVEQCRLPGSDCQQRSVLRQLKLLRHGYTELKARLEALEIKFVGTVCDQEAMDVTLRKVKVILREYDETFQMLKSKTYRLVGQ
ncbi:hypothetical protein KR200_001190, partial [Drosophila serrata]